MSIAGCRSHDARHALQAEYAAACRRGGGVLGYGGLQNLSLSLLVTWPLKLNSFVNLGRWRAYVIHGNERRQRRSGLRLSLLRAFEKRAFRTAAGTPRTLVPGFGASKPCAGERWRLHGQPRKVLSVEGFLGATKFCCFIGQGACRDQDERTPLDFTSRRR